MYNYGVEGDESLIQQDKISKKFGQQDDDMELSPRGEDHTAMISYFSSNLLRIGFTLQSFALFFMLVFYVAFGGFGIFVFDIYASPESVRLSSAFHLAIAILMSIYLLGVLYIAGFQVFVADNSKWSRGFRAGSKMLSGAVALDIVSSSLRFIQYLYAYYFMEMKWWAKFQQTKAEWALIQFGGLINVMSLLLYGAGLFYMEAYHDQGTSEETAWTSLLLFSVAAMAETVMIFSGFGAFFSLFLFAAIVNATIWAYSFEPLVEKWSPSLHSRDINSEIVPDGTAIDDNPGQDVMYAAQNVPSEYSTGNYPVNEEIPTSFDYSQLQNQLSQGVEMGVVGTGYPNYINQ